jgi:hypothetical protein
MAETARSKVSWIQKWREKRKLKRDRSGEKAEPVGERREAENEYDEDRMRKIGRGGFGG